MIFQAGANAARTSLPGRRRGAARENTACASAAISGFLCFSEHAPAGRGSTCDERRPGRPSRRRDRASVHGSRASSVSIASARTAGASRAVALEHESRDLGLAVAGQRAQRSEPGAARGLPRVEQACKDLARARQRGSSPAARSPGAARLRRPARSPPQPRRGRGIGDEPGRGRQRRPAEAKCPPDRLRPRPRPRTKPADERSGRGPRPPESRARQAVDLLRPVPSTDDTRRVVRGTTRPARSGGTRRIREPGEQQVGRAAAAEAEDRQPRPAVGRVLAGRSAARASDRAGLASRSPRRQGGLEPDPRVGVVRQRGDPIAPARRARRAEAPARRTACSTTRGEGSDKGLDQIGHPSSASARAATRGRGRGPRRLCSPRRAARSGRPPTAVLALVEQPVRRVAPPAVGVLERRDELGGRGLAQSGRRRSAEPRRRDPVDPALVAARGAGRGASRRRAGCGSPR